MQAILQIIAALAIALLSPGIAAAGSPLEFFDYVPGSRPEIERRLAGFDAELQIRGVTDVPVCPLVVTPNNTVEVDMAKVYLVSEPSGAGKRLLIWSKGTEWITEFVGDEYGADFHLFTPTDFNCSTNDCLLTLRRGNHAECLIDGS